MRKIDKIWIILILTGALYIGTMPIDFIIGDGAAEMQLAMSQSQSWNPSHLLTTPVYVALFEIARLLLPTGNEFIFIQLINILIGLTGMLLMFKSLTLMNFKVETSYLYTIIYGLCNGIWLHTTTMETGIHPQLFLMISFYYLIRHITVKRSSLYVAISFFAISVSILFALYLAVFLVPWFGGLLLRGEEGKAKGGTYKYLALASGVVFLTLLIPFSIAAIGENITSLTGFTAWLTSHSEAGRLAHLNPFSPEGLIRPIAGYMALMITPYNSLTIIKLLLRGDIAQGIDLLAYIRLAVSVAVGISFAGLILMGALAIRKNIIVVLSLFSLVFLFIFNLFWLGSDPQFWLPGLPFIITLIAFGFAKISQKIGERKFLRYSMAAIIVIFLFLNIPRGVPSMIYPGGDEFNKIALEFKQSVDHPYLVVSPGWGWVNYLRASGNGPRILDLVYDDSLGSGPDFYNKIDSILSHQINTGVDVYFDGLHGEEFVEQYGAWQMFNSCRGTARKNLYIFLKSRYLIEDLSGKYGGRLLLIRDIRPASLPGQPLDSLSDNLFRDLQYLCLAGRRFFELD